jgi:CDP-6-deoxy-D-xylo-4-hexulose-3-dehydrase|tara:strand:- start:544 stop:1857 length:1314 start_codon:yes stop_codon:yes gene_type:complete
MNKKDVEKQIKVLFEYWYDEKEKEDGIEKVRYAGPKLGKEEYLHMMDAIFDDWWSAGKYTYEAEKKLAQISDRNFGLLTNSGSSANLLLMAAAKELYFKDNDKILTLSCGFPTTVNPIIQNGLRPLFVDIDIETLGLSPSLFEEVLEKEDVKGVFIAHTLGFKGDIDSILDIARTKNIPVFFDACDAYGTKYKGLPIQSYGKAATFSFYVAHHITMGEGGGIVTNDENMQLAMRGFRNWGRYCSSPNCCIRSVNPNVFCPKSRLSSCAELPLDHPVNYQYEWLGYNLKPLELQSAILLSQMDKIDNFNRIRRKNYSRLYDYFSKSKLAVRTWEIDEETSPFSFPILLPKKSRFKRKHLIDHLSRDKIESRVLFGGNLLKHPAYLKKSHLWDSYQEIHENSDAILERFIMLGVSQINKEKDMDRIISSLENFSKKWQD